MNAVFESQAGVRNSCHRRHGGHFHSGVYRANQGAEISVPVESGFPEKLLVAAVNVVLHPFRNACSSTRASHSALLRHRCRQCRLQGRSRRRKSADVVRHIPRKGRQQIRNQARRRPCSQKLFFQGESSLLLPVLCSHHRAELGIPFSAGNDSSERTLRRCVVRVAGSGTSSIDG